MSLLAYQQMKPSGIEYSGEIPGDWSLKRLGDLVAFAQGKAHEPYIDDDGDYICVNSRFVSTSGKTIKTCSVNLTPASLNDILMVMSDLPNGRALARAYYVDDHGKYAVNQRVCRITAEKAHSRFLFYLLDRHPGLMQNDDGVHQTHLSNSDFQKLKLYLPSVSEQNQIARFLDHETARIDALIEEQQRLIELLKEKRQAVISHAVTKGLDPTVPMKDSGVEWLGEVPAHWTVRKVSVDFLASKGPRAALLTKEYCHENAGEYPVYSGQTENGGILGEIADFDIDLGAEGAILSTTVGAKAMSVMHISGRISLSQNCMIIRPFSTPVKVRFFFYHFQPLFSLERRMIPDHMQPSFRMEDLYSFRVAVPPVSEQNQIAEYLDTAVNRFDELIGEGDNGIALLQERRSALISAAVTGKIDVRGWQPPASSTSPELAQEAV
jgi:type I restriction enzyme S subunit